MVRAVGRVRLAATRQKNGTASTGKVPFGTYPARATLTGLPNCSPGKRSATGDACDIEVLQRFQHPYFAVHVAGAAQRSVNVLEAEMFI
ncbi:Uncharacterised protein [Klebsiella pneumoniae]|nr:Uncharacterised protein [Klebsiella pneumoniae]